MTATRLVFAAVLLLNGTSCRKSTTPAIGSPAYERPVVATDNYPLEFFATRIAENLARIEFPAPADVDPAEWHPTPQDLLNYRNADLILLSGASYARWTSHAPLAAARTFDTSAAFHDRLLTSRRTFTHNHGLDGEHEHHATDPHTWLDPSLARLHATAVHDALVALLPDHADTLGTNAADLDSDLAAIESALEALFQKSKPPFIASHPIYSYFARRFDLDIASLHWEPNVMPAQDDWIRLEKLLTERPGAVMIWEDEPLPAIRKRLASMKLRFAVVRVAANRPPTGNLINALQANLENLEDALH